MNTKTFNKITCCLLVFVLLFTGVFFPIFKKEAYATTYDDNFESYLSGNDISDEYIEEIEEMLVDKYSQYVYFDRYIYMDTTEVEEKYGPIIYEYVVPIEYVDEEDVFDIYAVRMIRRNINLMNELVREDLGTIEGDGEFYFYYTDEFVEQWQAWGFQLKWNKFSVNFDSDFAILFASVFLILDVVVELRDLQLALDTMKYNDDVIVYAVEQAFYFIPIDLASQLVSFFTSDILGYLVSACGWAVDILSTSTVVWAVIKIVYGILMPSVTDCIIVLYKAIAEYCGVELKLCWIPTWWDKWGLSIKSI